MRQRLIMALLLLALPATALLAIVFATPAQSEPDPRGIWLTEKEQAAVKLADCADGDGLCGTVWWLEPGGLTHDEHNPDPDKRDRPLCRLEVMWGFQKDGGRKWDSGSLYKVDEGEVYSAFLKLKSPDRLKVSGYIGFEFLSKSQTWTRTGPDAYPKCEAPDAAPASVADSEPADTATDTPATGK